MLCLFYTALSLFLQLVIANPASTFPRKSKAPSSAIKSLLSTPLVRGKFNPRDSGCLNGYQPCYNYPDVCAPDGYYCCNELIVCPDNDICLKDNNQSCCPADSQVCSDGTGCCDGGRECCSDGCCDTGSYCCNDSSGGCCPGGYACLTNSNYCSTITGLQFNYEPTKTASPLGHLLQVPTVITKSP